MPAEEEFAKELARQLPVKAIYKDTAAPAAKQAGQFFEDIIKAVQLALAPVRRPDPDKGDPGQIIEASYTVTGNLLRVYDEQDRMLGVETIQAGDDAAPGRNSHKLVAPDDVWRGYVCAGRFWPALLIGVSTGAVEGVV